MPLEATMMIIDNSEFMRNGDYMPTRFEAQSDAVNTVVQTKIDSNPENTVGIMTMAGKGPEVLVTHTKEHGHILAGLHETRDKLSGIVDIPTAISVAQLALKHRPNKNLRQRIMVFVGSPLEGPAADEKNMVRLAKKLKKNNVAVDIVAFGDGVEEGAEGGVMKAFVENVNSAENSHLVQVPPGAHLISDVLLTSPILAGDRPDYDAMITDAAGGGDAAGASGSGGGGGGGGSFEFGVDPSLDPELAMALRMSMEEEQARIAAAGGPATAGESSSTASAAAPPATTAAQEASSQPAAAAAAVDEDDEEAQLRQALALSQQDGGDVEMSGSTARGSGDADEEMSEEDEIARAIAMSIQQDEEDGKK